MKISLGIVDILILSLALQGLVLSGLLFYSSRKINSNRWIAAFIFVISETTLVMEAMSSGFLMEHTRLIPFFLVLRMALGPLIYFYTRSLLYGNKKLRSRDYLHFLPILLDMQPQVIYLLYVTGILSIPSVQHFYFLPATQNVLFHQTVLNNLPSFFSLLIYSGASYYMMGGELKDPAISVYKVTDLKWLKNLLLLIFALISFWLITILFSYVSGWNNYILYIPATVFIYWLGMSAYLRQSKMSENDILEYNKPPTKVYFSDDEADKYHRQLIALMETGRFYLNPVLKLDFLAGQLALNERSISNLLNQHVGKNFNDFINEYRIEEAKKKLGDASFQQFTIASIAFDCGFNSLATFQRCFKQFTGVTPSEYQKTVKPAIVK